MTHDPDKSLPDLKNGSWNMKRLMPAHSAPVKLNTRFKKIIDDHSKPVYGENMKDVSEYVYFFVTYKKTRDYLLSGIV